MIEQVNVSLVEYVEARPLKKVLNCLIAKDKENQSKENDEYASYGERKCLELFLPALQTEYPK